jgi:hypothetical protein
MSVRPHRLVFGGRIDAAAIWIDRDLLGELEARRRVLRLLGEGVRVHELARGYLCRFDAPRSIDADRCEGVPMQRRGHALVGAPLRALELDAAAPPVDAAILLRDGIVHTHVAADTKPVDASTWIDVSDFIAHATVPLGVEPEAARPRLVGGGPPTDVRSILGGAVPPASDEQAQILAALDDARAGRAPSETPGVLGRFLRTLVGARTPGQEPALPPGPAGAAGTSLPTEPGWLARAFRRLVLGSPLASVLGRRQAQYFAKMMKLFEDEQWDAALRHAIPFGSLPGPPKPPALGVPSPRADLRLSPRVGGASSTAFNLPPDFYEELKDLYRKTARALEEEGRIEEAAFVHFELLGENDEGIAMLERHEKFELAAQLAEGRDMAAGLVIRLWFLAGQPARAILVARRTGAYADAILRLERNRPELAQSLRVMWGHRLATAGDYAAAVDAVWSVERARGLAAEWVERAIALGGPTGSRMLAKKLALWPGVATIQQQVHDAVASMVADPSDDARWRRRELARAFATLPGGVPLLPELARLLARRLMLDADDSARAMIELSHDATLRTDTIGVAAPIADTPTPVHAPIFVTHERGLLEPTHAASLDDGRFLVALGEAGLRLVASTGKVHRAWEQPADRIVLASSSSRAIAIASRGATRTLSRIDLVTGARERWCDARFDLHAAAYDGAIWFLTVDDAVVGVDAQSDGLDALWRIGGLPSRPLALAWAPGWLTFVLTEEGSGFEVWRYELGASGPVLRRRRSVEIRTDDELVGIDVEPEGGLVLRYHKGLELAPTARIVASSPTGRVAELVVRERGTLHARTSHLDHLVDADGAIELHRLSWTDLSRRGPIVRLEGALEATLHDRAGHLVLADDHGRVVLVDANDRIAAAVFV